MGELYGMFAVGDALGGGTENDVHQSFKSFVEVLGLSEEDVGTVIIATSEFLTATDLVLTSATWRSLLVTAVLAGVALIIKDVPARRKATVRLLDAVEHWWPRYHAEAAFRAFRQRKQFLEPLHRAGYVDLQERAQKLRRKRRLDRYMGRSDWSEQSLVVQAGSSPNLDGNSDTETVSI